MYRNRSLGDADALEIKILLTRKESVEAELKESRLKTKRLIKELAELTDKNIGINYGAGKTIIENIRNGMNYKHVTLFSGKKNEK